MVHCIMKRSNYPFKTFHCSQNGICVLRGIFAREILEKKEEIEIRIIFNYIIRIPSFSYFL